MSGRSSRTKGATGGFKICTKCGEELPATGEYFPLGKVTGVPNSPCRKCRADRLREWREANKEHVKEYAKQYQANHRPEKRARDKVYRETHRDTFLACMRRWYEQNKEYAQQQNKEWAAANEDKMRQYKRDWNKRNPDYCRMNARLRHARKRTNGGVLTQEDVKGQYIRQNGKCFYCGKKLNDEYHIDHVTPVALGGTTSPENIVVTCPKCNFKKNSKHPMDFAGIML